MEGGRRREGGGREEGGRREGGGREEGEGVTGMVADVRGLTYGHLMMYFEYQ